MPRVYVENDALCFGKQFRISFHRTLRTPEGAREFPLPPSFGRFPVHPLDLVRPDASFGAQDAQALEVVLPMRNHEAMWVGVEGEASRPHAVLIGSGAINALTGEPWEECLRANPQNYMVCPDQSWLDGINAGDGFVRQFVATPLGSGLSVEEQLGALAPAGGLRVTVFEPKPGKLTQRSPRTSPTVPPQAAMEMPPVSGRMSLGAGGKIRQKIYPDPYGMDVWEQSRPARAVVRIFDSAQFRAATGRDAPASPIDAQTYASLGLPWFELYEEDRADLPPSARLARLKTIGGEEETDGEHADPDTLRILKLPRRPPRGDT